MTHKTLYFFVIVKMPVTTRSSVPFARTASTLIPTPGFRLTAAATAALATATARVTAAAASAAAAHSLRSKSKATSTSSTSSTASTSSIASRVKSRQRAPHVDYSESDE